MKRYSPHPYPLLLSAVLLVLGSNAQGASVSNGEQEPAPQEPAKRVLPLKTKPAAIQPAEPAPEPSKQKSTTTPTAPRKVAPTTVAPQQSAPRATVPTKPQVAPQAITPRGTAPRTERTPASPSTAAAGLQLVSPNGGESIRPGSRITIQWQASGIRGPGVIQLLRGGRKVADISRSVNLSNGSAAWRVPANLEGGDYTVLVQSRDGKYSDSSDRPFAIGTAPAAGSAGTAEATGNESTTEEAAAPATPSLGFISPTNHTGWCTNEPHEFRWNSTLPAGSNVTIELMHSDGQTLWQTIATNTEDDGSYTWPGLTDAQFPSGSISLRPRIRSADNSVVQLGDPMNFGKPLMLNTPQSNHTWRKGSQYTIRWTQLCNLPTSATLELLDAGQQPVLTIAEGLPSAGHYMPRWHEWTVPSDLVAGTYHIRVRTADHQLVRTGSFKIANPVSIATSTALTFTSPTPDTGWCTNEPHEFRWSTTLPASTRVRIDLMDGNGETVWRNLASDQPNSGSYLWPGMTDAQFGFGMGTFRPRIATLDNSEVTVGEFLHFGKRLMLEAPKSNYTWRKGSQYDIKWTQLCDLPAPVEIELLNANRQSIATLANGLPATGSTNRRVLPWTVPANLAAGTYHIRVQTTDQQYVQESSFTIGEPSP